ncbi:hypothetical protein F511_19142 [Dorcoceras hygrometricum]|uniref:Uncharacterized protein n=1 Tax=Dorcoceras hygrometricum TaxID=472368 RepID=A0A2Z7BK38_9LAMI|nr:hypothetical protein F511_19142 [Dorcoceras hygrometricum]
MLLFHDQSRRASGVKSRRGKCSFRKTKLPENCALVAAIVPKIQRLQITKCSTTPHGGQLSLTGAILHPNMCIDSHTASLEETHQLKRVGRVPKGCSFPETDALLQKISSVGLFRSERVDQLRTSQIISEQVDQFGASHVSLEQADQLKKTQDKQIGLERHYQLRASYFSSGQENQFTMSQFSSEQVEQIRVTWNRSDWSSEIRTVLKWRNHLRMSFIEDQLREQLRTHEQLSALSM